MSPQHSETTSVLQCLCTDEKQNNLQDRLLQTIVDFIALSVLSRH